MRFLRDRNCNERVDQAADEQSVFQIADFLEKMRPDLFVAIHIDAGIFAVPDTMSALGAGLGSE